MSLKGRQFVHHFFIDPEWNPGKGQKYKDGPKALMQITSATKSTVYYSYAVVANVVRASFRMNRTDFMDAYGEELT